MIDVGQLHTMNFKERRRGRQCAVLVVAIIVASSLIGLWRTASLPASNERRSVASLVHFRQHPEPASHTHTRLMIPPPTPWGSEPLIEAARAKLELQVRSDGRRDVPQTLLLRRELQDATRAALVARYGRHEHYYVRVHLTYEDYSTYFSLRLTDVEGAPVASYAFLEMARTFTSGGFKRMTDGIVQTSAHSDAVKKPLAFEESSQPIDEASVGFALNENDPSKLGPGWFVSLKQQEHDEKFVVIGTVIEGFHSVILHMHEHTDYQGQEGGWLLTDQRVEIDSMSILVSSGRHENQWTVWKDVH